MKKYIIFLLMTILLIGLATVSAEEITQDNTATTTAITSTQTSTADHQIETNIDNNHNNIKKEKTSTTNTKKSEQTTNTSHEQESNTIHKTRNNVKTASASEELHAIEASTKSKLENAFLQAQIEIDQAQSTYEKEQIPNSVKDIAQQIAAEAQRAETIYSQSGDTSLNRTIYNIRNYAGYADLLIHPEKLTDPSLASKYNTRPLDIKDGKYDLLTIVAQRVENTQESVYINLTSNEFQNLYNDVGEIHHPGEYDRYGHVVLVNKTKFIQVTDDPSEFEIIPFPLARIYLEASYNQNYYYTQTFASSGNTSGGWYHVYGSTLTKSKYTNYTTNTMVDGNSGIVFWKMLVTDNPDMKYVLTDERYYPDIYGHPPDNMPAENNDKNGIYFVGYVIKSETGGIHIDGVIVEYRTPENTYDVNFTARKVWSDSNNQDGIKPATVTIQLLADGEKYGDNIVLHAGNNWKYDYINLPRYRKNTHDEIVYTINELTVPQGYSVSYNGYTVTNTHIPETRNITVLKTWDDDYNRDRIRPDSITVDLYADKVLKQTATINNNNWEYTFRNLAVYNNGNKISYTIKERAIDKYTTTIQNVSNGFIINNKYTPITKNVTVKKIWDDKNNQDGIRPTTITIQLLKDETPYQNPITLNNNNNWTYTFKNLPANADGTPIKYTAIETSIPTGYTATNNGLTITNKHTPEKTQIEVFKEWDDDHNRDGIRPNSITVDLYANNAIKETVTITNTNWRHTFKNLDVYHNGNKITYTVKERKVDKYESSIRKNNNEFTITNKYTPITKNVTVKKIWDDKNNQDGIRPTTITIQLLKDETPYQNPITLNNNNNWTYTFKNLPANADGTPIKYTAIETSIPTGYTATNNGLTITNKHTPEKTQIEVFKEWDDDHNRDGIRPDSVAVNLLANGEVVDETVLSSDNLWRHEFEGLDVYRNGRKITYTVTENRVANYTTTITSINNEFIIRNTHKPLVKELNVLKVWDDHDNEHDLRPDSVQVQLFADGEKYGDPVTLTVANDWRNTFSNLPVNFDGKEIFYVVKEVILPEEYYNEITFTGDNEITITNIFDPEHAHVKVIKEWDDNHDSDKLRPTSVQVQLYANGVKQGNPVTLNQNNYWRHSFDNLLKYDDDEEIVYTVQEVTPVTGYTSSVKTLAKNEYAIVNVHTPETINVTINKVWEDDNNRDGIRPDSVDVILLRDGEEIDTVTLSESNKWTYTFTDLTKNFDGKEIVYSVEEIGLTEGYVTKYDGFTITNVHTPETVELHVVKEWIGNYDQDGLRPKTIQIELNKNGEKTQDITLSENNNWTHIFTNLPKYENGKEIQYTITETTVPNYTTKITNNNNKIIIQNTHIPEKINITINKKWDDNNNQDGIRPDSVRIELLSDGERVATVSLSESNGWAYTFNNLDKYHRGNVIKYTINEIGIPEGYTVTYNGYTVTNTHTPETVELHIVKEWIGNYDQDGLRPKTIQIQLNKNGEKTQDITLSENNNWTHIFTNLPKYENGKEIQYTITETTVPNYTTKITNNNNKIIIQNTHIPEKINITINKKWDGKNNQDGIRPDSVLVALLANGQEYDIVRLSDANDWTYTFNDLDKNLRGSPIKYTVAEIGIPDGYTVVYDGYTIINVHTPESVDVNVIVEWDDLENIDEIRPDNVTIILYKDDEPIKNVTITPDDDWKTIFENLPKYENGTLINYTADEILPDGYTRTIEINDYEIIITNIHRPAKINITVNKVWIDNDNKANTRPESIQVQLLADGEEYATVTLDAMNSWEYPFINLPKTKKGVEIVYTLKELDVVENYESVISGYTITNTYVPETVDIIVNVDWDDLNDTDGIRPDNVTIILYEDDEPVKNVTITPDDDWKTIFEDLPKYDENGTLINYTADEVLPDGYTKTIEINENEINITNIHRPTVDITVDIEWDDLEDEDGIRPDTVTLILYEDGKEIKRVTVTPDDWSTVFENLPKFKDGKEIQYTIDEVLPNGYTKTITRDGNHFTVTNKHRPVVDITVDIEWDDLEDQDGIRPDSVNIILYENGKEIKNVVVTKDTWNTIFENLPKYKDEKEIQYTIDEVLPNGYTKTITRDGNHFTVTNVHRPETMNVPVKIVWDDLNDIDAIRPDTVTLILYADGKEVKKVTVTPDDDWKTIFENLPINANGKPIEYRVDEVLPNGYTKTIDYNEKEIVITNIHRPQLVWKWKLVEIIPDDKPIDNHTNITPSDKQPSKTVSKTVYNKWNAQSRYTRYSNYNRYSRYNSYNRYSRYNRYNRYNGHGNRNPHILPRYLYRLYIQLYNAYLAGNITYADFIVILEKEGLDPELLTFNEDGTITIDYENIEDVPENITVMYKDDTLQTTSDQIDTSNPDNYESPVIDAGEVEIPAKESKSSSNTDSNSNAKTSQASSAQSSNSEPSVQSENVEES